MNWNSGCITKDCYQHKPIDETTKEMEEEEEEEEGRTAIENTDVGGEQVEHLARARSLSGVSLERLVIDEGHNRRAPLFK